MSNFVKINVDGKFYEVKAGQNLIEACKTIGIEIPHFCYHHALKIAGSCRMCLVSTGLPSRDRSTSEVLKNTDGSLKIAWAPKLSLACATNVCNDLHVITDSDEIKKAREGVLEFILINHPLDCPICDKAGECKLQEYSSKFGSGKSRFVEDKNIKPKKQNIAGKILLDNERCILCSRCIRICQEVVGKNVLGFTKRGSHTELTHFKDVGTDSNYLLNIVDNCPVGALTEKSFRFKMRPWFLKTTNNICSESSAGTNTVVWSRGDEIYRITPRRNDFVNGAWMTDSARVEFKKFESARFSKSKLDGTPCETSYALSRAAEILKLKQIGIVVSGKQTLEEHFILKELSQICNAKVYARCELQKGDGFLMSRDRYPNTRGLFVSELIDKYPSDDFSGLAEDIRIGKIKNILCFGEDLLSWGLDEKDFKSANIVYAGAMENATARAARLAIPLRTHFEKDGMYINRQWRLQKFYKSIEAPKNVLGTIEFSLKILTELGENSFDLPDISEIRKVIHEKNNIIPCSVGDEGVVIDSSKFAHINFPDKI